MPATLARAIGVPAQQQHSDEARHKWNRAHPANALNISPTGEPLEHRRHPKPKGVSASVAEEQPDGEQHHRPLPERLPNRNVLYVCFGAPLFGKERSLLPPRLTKNARRKVAAEYAQNR